tara:strand:+ start:934 stop:1500 length:567 start_codon:yes stop_codon:yes gene_type:complete
MKKNDECLELKNIKYKTMLMNNIQPSKEPQITNIENFLEKEKSINKKQHWSKLSTLSKKTKLTDYCNTYAETNNLSLHDKEQLRQFLLKSLERKKLQRVKDVIYDIETQVIINIPSLSINKTTNKYTLKNLEKKVSTLKSLAPRKNKGKKKKGDKEKNKEEKEKKRKKKKKDKKIKDKNTSLPQTENK